MTQARKIKTVVALLSLAAAGAVGCRTSPTPPSSPASTAAAATPSPAATPTPFPVTVSASGLDSTLFDDRGHTIAQIKAARVQVKPDTTPGKGGELGSIDAGEAVLYQNNQPAARFRADTLQTDRQSRVLTGRGHVEVHSLSADAPAIRADTMTWKYDENKIYGQGHVLVTRLPDLRMPGDSFVADTQIRQFTVHNNSGAPATGSF